MMSVETGLRAASDGAESTVQPRVFPALGAVCIAVIVGSSLLAVFFGDWVPVGPQNAPCLGLVILSYRQFIYDGTHLNTFILSLACFGGFLSTGALKWKLGLPPLVLATVFGGLYFICELRPLFELRFLPSFIYQDLIGNVSLNDVPFYLWWLLTFVAIPLIYLVGTLSRKSIPLWKAAVLVICPLVVFFFILIAILRYGLKSESYALVVSRGMMIWILFAFVVFSELLRQRVRRTYVWLTVGLSAAATGIAMTVIFLTAFSLYREVVASRHATGHPYEPCYYKDQ